MARNNKRRSTKRMQGQQGGAGVAEFGVKTFGANADIQSTNSLREGDNVIKPMNGGAKRRHARRHANKSQKGGYWAQVISSAVVPLSLFALNQHFANKSKRHASKHDNKRHTMKKR
jgi:hypothetical protein